MSALDDRQGPMSQIFFDGERFSQFPDRRPTKAHPVAGFHLVLAKVKPRLKKEGRATIGDGAQRGPKQKEAHVPGPSEGTSES